MSASTFQPVAGARSGAAMEPARPRPSASSPPCSGLTAAAPWREGFDVSTQADQVRTRIGVTGQSATIDELLTGSESLETIGRFCHLGSSAVRRRADERLRQFDLRNASTRLVKR